jgi:hypothetical protein
LGDGGGGAVVWCELDVAYGGGVAG